MKNLFFAFLVFGFTFQAFAQDPKVEALNEIFIEATNYKYLDATGTRDMDKSVLELERAVATFDIEDTEMYRDDYDKYYISFFIPEGKILATYNKDGKILRTAERFEKINLPYEITSAVENRFPLWQISKNVYLVNYHETKGVTKRYKLLLENGKERIRVQIDDKGTFL